MAGKRAEPGAKADERDEQADVPDGGGAPGAGDLRTGPLALERCRKADGRALLLYSRVEDAG